MSSDPIAVEQLEGDIARDETVLQVELEKVLSSWREAAARLNGVKQKLAQAQGLGHDVRELMARVATMALPQLNPGTAMLRSEALRREAVAARKAGVQELRARLPAFASEISRLSLKIAAEEGAVSKQVGLAKAVALQVAEAARKLDPSTASGQAPTPILPPEHPKREQARVRMQVKIDFSSDNNFYSGFSTDISAGGVFIATVKVVPVGTPMDLFFRLPNGDGVDAQGVVRWVREVDDSRPEMMPGLGVQFVSLNVKARAAVETFIRAREPMFYPD